MKIVFRPTRLDKDFLGREFAPVLRNCIDAFLILCAVFAVATLLIPGFADGYLALIEDVMAQAGVLEAGSSAEMAVLLLTNNLRATINAVFYGFVPFIRYPALVLGSNALTLSAMGVTYIRDGLYTPAAFFAGILPHGIFEILALLISCAVGLCHCRLATDLILKKELTTPARTQIVSLAWVYAAMALPLLIIAALVEAFLTPAVMQLFL